MTINKNKQNNNNNKLALSILSLIFVLSFASPVLASEINIENVVKYVNEARTKKGIKELRVSEKLNEVAQAKVNDMVAHNYFAHTSPAGLNPWHWFELVGYDYKYAGENLAINFITAEAQQSAWMKSPTHRKNLLNINYTEIGVAVAVGEVNGSMGIIAVQEFGSLAHPGAKSDNKNFAPIKNNTLTDNAKFTPAVLSVGNNKLENITEKNVFEQKNTWSLQDGAGDVFWLVLVSLTILPIIVVQISAVVQKGYESKHVNNTREYFRKLKVRDYGKYQIIKVKIVTT